ncbi:uncharacterized protein LOC120330749 [Styela clava]
MEQEIGPAVSVSETNITHSDVQDLSVNNAAEVSVTAERSDIAHVDEASVIAEQATVTARDTVLFAEQCHIASNETSLQAEEVSISTEQANVTSGEAIISANVLQQTNNNETIITGAAVQDMSIESAKDVSVISEHTEIASQKTTVKTVEANVSATKAHISAETLQQTNITETSITRAAVQDMSIESAKDVSVISEHTEIVSQKATVRTVEATLSAAEAHISAETLQQTNITESSITGATVQDMSIESAKDVTVISEHTEIASQKATVQTVEANVSATESHISAETLQQTNITETSITGAAVQDMSIESAKDVSVISEHTEIASQKATVQTVEATLSAAEAHISAETLQQTNITETSITMAAVQDMSIESAKDVSVISEHTEIASKKATVQTVEANVSATEAHISTETLQQTNITETSITGAAVQDMSIENAKEVSVISEHTEIASQKATVQTVEANVSATESHISAETLQQTNITETSITGAAVQNMSIESAKDVSVISEHTEIASQNATVQTVEATLSAAEAHISAETLQQTNITETSITGAAVQDMSIESAKDVSVISEHTEIASQKATVQTVEATLSAAEAQIYAETLQQTNITGMIV